MKRLDKIIINIVLLLILLIGILNLCFIIQQRSTINEEYSVEINRAFNTIKEEGINQLDISNFSTLIDVWYLKEDATNKEREDFYKKSNTDSLILMNETTSEVEFYRFFYTTNTNSRLKDTQLLLNIGLISMLIFVIGILQYVKYAIIKPFERIRDFPYELAKGHLTKSLPESKNRFFGNFIWGLDLLRENLEYHKKHELELEKEKKLLVLSISHDIETPLSTIKLYAKALEKNLYSTEEKHKEVATNIGKKVEEIEEFVSQIVKTTKEDFLHIEVNSGEFYLEELIERLKDYYEEKLVLLGHPFCILEYDNCILKGDIERSLEVCENIIENAIKYGDGKLFNITFSKEEDCQLITFTNSGNTLLSTEVIHMFESFWRGENAYHKEGSGLGLYICRQIMSKMNGEIYAQPQGELMSITIVIGIA